MEIEFSLSDYWGIVRKRLLAVILTFTATFVGVVAYTTLKVPLYRAQVMVKYEPTGAQSIRPDLASYMLGPAIQTQVSLLTSMDMAERIAKKMGWDLKRAQRAYKAEKLGQSSLIQISAVGEEPAATASLANLVAETYIAWDLESRSAHIRKALDDLTARQKDAEETLRNLEHQRKIFMEEHETTGLSSALANNLLDLESRQKELLKKFTPRHPEIKKLDQRINLVRKRLMALPAEQDELQRLSRDIKVREETYVALSRQIDESKIALESTLSFISIVSRATPPVSPYLPNKPLNYSVGFVLAVFFGVFTALLLESLDISITTIEEIEKVLEAPVLGIIPFFGSSNKWHDFLVNFMRKDRHPEETFRSFLIFRHSPKSPNIEVYHSLRVNIQAQLSKPENMVLTFTSTGVAEGKTLTAVNFAMAAAHSGLKTLLIGADIRRPSLHRIFGLPKEPGLIEALIGKVPWQETIRNTVDILMGEQDLDRLSSFPGIDNFKVMTGWTSTTAEIVNLFSSHRLPKLIAELRAHFDIVIFDCPPVLLFVDAMLIGAHTDGVVLIYRSGKMARRALKRAKDQVQVSKGKILGIVLNGARATDMEPGYGYYSDYGHYTKQQGDAS